MPKDKLAHHHTLRLLQKAVDKVNKQMEDLHDRKGKITDPKQHRKLFDRLADCTFAIHLLQSPAVAEEITDEDFEAILGADPAFPDQNFDPEDDEDEEDVIPPKPTPSMRAI